MLRYHRKTLELVGAVPKLAPQAAVAIATIEKRIGRPLPASLREWYSLEGACDLLNRYSNDDPSVLLSDLGQNPVNARDFLVIRHENQGVCTWAVWLNSSDDPPVFVDYDRNFETPQACANSFSDYVYSCVWDWGQVLARQQGLIQSQNSPISDEALSFLRKNFKSEIETNGWPGDVQYRFFSGDQRILVWAGKEQADWWLVGETEEALLRLLKQLWNVDELGNSFWSNDRVGESILQRARAGT